MQGRIEGSVNADIVEVKAAGHIRGEITSNELVIESKGIFEGNSIVKESVTSTKIEKATIAKS